MSAKTELWDRLGKTDPSQTKSFQRAGGFKGTAIKPMWSYRRMTEEYGPCGVGWGVGEPTFKIIEAGDEILVYCIASVWHGSRENIVFGVGGDKAVAKFSSGIKTDDEALKKAFTDGVTNALKMIGVGADVHMGLFEDSKYVSEMKAEYSMPRDNPHVTRAADIVPAAEYDENGEVIDNIPHPHPDAIKKLRVVDQRPIFAAMQKEIQATGSITELQAWAAANKDRLGSLKPDWQDFLRGVFAEHRDAIRQLEQGDDNRMAG